jgi:hypothetical protein
MDLIVPKSRVAGERNDFRWIVDGLFSFSINLVLSQMCCPWDKSDAVVRHSSNLSARDCVA